MGQGRINHHRIHRQGRVARTVEILTASIGPQQEIWEIVAIDHRCHAGTAFVQANPLEGRDSHNSSSDSSLPKDFSTKGGLLVFLKYFFFFNKAIPFTLRSGWERIPEAYTTSASSFLYPES